MKTVRRKERKKSQMTQILHDDTVCDKKEKKIKTQVVRNKLKYCLCLSKMSFFYDFFYK